MILIEDEVLADDIQAAKAQVLAVLQPTDPVWTYQRPADLATFLDALRAGLDAHGFPPALSRVVLFYRHPAALGIVRRRMHRDGKLISLAIPGAWLALTRDPVELRTWGTNPVALRAWAAACERIHV